MENILNVYKELYVLASNHNENDLFKFKNLLKDYLGMCSEKLEIPDFLLSLAHLTFDFNREQRTVTHIDSNEIYSFRAFATGTSKNRKQTDVIYAKNIKISASAHLFFVKKVSEFNLAFNIADNYLSYIIAAAIDAERLCYSGKGFPRNGQESFMEYYLKKFCGNCCAN